MPDNAHDKTWVTEMSALLTLLFTIYQGYKHGGIEPALIGQLFVNSYDLLSIVIPSTILVARLIYKKFFRRAKAKNARRAMAVVEADRGMNDNT
jgi:hypothetical protein